MVCEGALNEIRGREVVRQASGAADTDNTLFTLKHLQHKLISIHLSTVKVSGWILECARARPVPGGYAPAMVAISRLCSCVC